MKSALVCRDNLRWTLLRALEAAPKAARIYLILPSKAYRARVSDRLREYWFSLGPGPTLQLLTIAEAIRTKPRPNSIAAIPRATYRAAIIPGGTADLLDELREAWEAAGGRIYIPR